MIHEPFASRLLQIDVDSGIGEGSLDDSRLHHVERFVSEYSLPETNPLPYCDVVIILGGDLTLSEYKCIKK